MITKNENSYLTENGYSSGSRKGFKYHVWLDKIEMHARDIDIEAQALYDMVTGQIIPQGMKYQKELTQSISGSSDMNENADMHIRKDLLIGVTMLLSSIKAEAGNLKSTYEKSALKNGEFETDNYDDLKTKIDAIKKDVTKFEALINYQNR